MTKQLKEIEIPFGAKDSELCGWEYSIPEGMEATIVDNKIVVKKKDSGDERIRKALLDEFIHLQSKGYKFAGLEGEEIVAWLEKQGEKKSLDDIVKKVIKDKDAAISFLKSCGIMNENGELADEYKIKQGEKNPAWSEEDEKFVHGLIRGLSAKRDIYRHTTFSSDCIDITETINWLESLKSRVLLYPVSVEYNEEDIDNIADMFIPEPVWNALEESEGEGSNAAAYDYSQMIAMFKAGVHWLKSLKPQNTWKPSDEQINGIECAIKTLHYQLNVGDGRLDSLYHDLKNLRKE